MMTEHTKELLRDYTRNRSEDAFRALVREHSPLVYGTALRRLGGDRAAAQDVTQEVFTLLARKAHQLESMVLGGWLYRQACRRAADHVRAEVRRKKRELIAMENQHPTPPEEDFLAKELDEALLALAAKDRDALILRFFENKEFRALGSALGLSEEAARKRVTRALERLTEHLKRKGVPVGSVSLGTAMQAYGATPVPATVISRVSENAFRASAASGFVPLFSLFIPIAAGVAVASLVAVSIQPASVKKDSPVPATTTQVRQTRPAMNFLTSDKNPSLEQLLVEIKRIHSKPANTLTAIQLRMVFDRIDPAQVPEFILLANDRMTVPERAAFYQRLLEKSLAAAPEKTMDFVLSEDLGKQTDAYNSTNLLTNLFIKWMRKDRPASESWLIEHWESTVLREPAFEVTLRNLLMTKLAGERFINDGVASVLELVHRIPARQDQAAVLRGISGINGSSISWDRGEQQKCLDFHHALKEFPDADSGRELIQNFWKILGEEKPREVDEIRAAMEPMDRFLVSLGSLAVKTRRGGETRLLAGYSMQTTPLTDLEKREAAAVEAGLSAGLSKAQAMVEISRVHASSMSAPEFIKWFDAQEDVSQMDETLAAKTRKSANEPGWTQGEEMVAVDLAMRISDPELRLKLCRGAFRMRFARTRAAALDYLKNPALPADLADEFQNIISQTP